MSNGEVLSRLVDTLGVCVDERRARISEDIGVGLVFHHDQENVIEPTEIALRMFSRYSGANNQRRRTQREQGVFHNRFMAVMFRDYVTNT